jgi:hypothetical protein
VSVSHGQYRPLNPKALANASAKAMSAEGASAAVAFDNIADTTNV